MHTRQSKHALNKTEERKDFQILQAKEGGPRKLKEE